jgi:hypothetical protein
MELSSRRTIARHPVDHRAVSVQEKKERGAGHFEFFEQLFAPDLASAGPEKDEVILQELLVFWVVVVLLTQQYAGASVEFSEKVEEKRFSRSFGLGQGLVQRACPPRLGRHR